MRKIDGSVFKNMQYISISLIMAVLLWGVVNLGSRSTIVISTHVELKGAREDLVYIIDPRVVDIRLTVVERLLLSDKLDRIEAYIDVSRLDEPGGYMVKVNVKNTIPILIQPIGVNPSWVEVLVEKNPLKQSG